MFLKCLSCGYESPGWTVSRASAATSANPDDSSWTLVRARLIGASLIVVGEEHA